MWWISLLLSALGLWWYFGMVDGYRKGWLALLQQAPQPSQAWPKVTVLVAARNEAARIGPLLDSLMQQDYPGWWEAIIVDDFSSDATAEVVAAAGDVRIHCHRREEADGFSLNKKGALTSGIRRAQGEVIVATDADCWMGPAWISSMVGFFEQGVDFVSGPVLLQGPRNWQFEMQGLEYMSLNAIGAAAIQLGAPNMCTGINMAYRKAAFDAVGGYAGNDHIASGDDEFLLHKIQAYNPAGIRFCLQSAALVCTKPELTVTGLLRQRIRWVSKQQVYAHTNRHITRRLQTAWLFNAWVFVLFCLGVAWQLSFLYLFAIVFTSKCWIEYRFLKVVSPFYQRQGLERWVPLEQLFYIPYVLIVGLGSFTKNYQWKGRNHRMK